MAVLAKIREAGFDLALEGDRIKVVPASKLTTSQREFIRLHKLELVAELRSADQPSESATEMEIAPSVQVKCCECRHFVRDTIGDGSGIGSCAVGGNATRAAPSKRYPTGYLIDYPLYPFARRICGKFTG